MDWNDVAVARLRILWENGVTTAEIGRRLECSKNAVVGKAHRLELQDRPSPIKGRVTLGLARAQPSIPRPKITLPPLPRYVPPPVVTAAQPRVVAPPPRPLPAPVQFPQQSAGRCFYPLWRNGERPKFREDGSALLCSDPITRGSFCAVHAASCYSGHQWKSEEAAA